MCIRDSAIVIPAKAGTQRRRDGGETFCLAIRLGSNFRIPDNFALSRAARSRPSPG
jgi:hypothetical protein